MSALGQKQTCAAPKVMSALPPNENDMCGALAHVCFGPIGDIHTLKLRCALAQLLDCRDNAPELTGDGFGDNFKRWIPDLLHGYGRVDGGNFDLTASEVLHDHVAR